MVQRPLLTTATSQHGSLEQIHRGRKEFHDIRCTPETITPPGTPRAIQTDEGRINESIWGKSFPNNVPKIKQNMDLVDQDLTRLNETDAALIKMVSRCNSTQDDIKNSFDAVDPTMDAMHDIFNTTLTPLDQRGGDVDKPREPEQLAAPQSSQARWGARQDQAPRAPAQATVPASPLPAPSAAAPAPPPPRAHPAGRLAITFG